MNSTYENLDIVLTFLRTPPARPFINEDEINMFLKEPQFKYDELHRLLDKLYKDGYVKIEHIETLSGNGVIQPVPFIETQYSITFEGEHLIKAGGYVRKNKIDKRNQQLKTVRVWGIVVAAVATAIISFWELVLKK